MAADVNTTPNQVFTNLAEERIANVVPRLVAESAAPETKHCRYVAVVRGLRTKLSATGTQIPVRATKMERKRLETRDRSEVPRPPIWSGW